MGKGMRAGKRPKTGGGGGKKGQMAQIQQMQAMQRQMEQMQAELDAKEYEASAGGGVVNAKFNGRREMLELTIEPDVVDPDDIETLQDLIIATVNDGMRKIEQDSDSKYGELTGGIDIPGM